jgi:DNA replication protein DnaC
LVLLHGGIADPDRCPRLITREPVNLTFRNPAFALCASDSWIGEGANLLLIGGQDGGKTHLASAIGLLLVENGFRVLFARTSYLVQKLQATRRGGTEAAINRLERFHLLILDDLAYASKDQAKPPYFLS